MRNWNLSPRSQLWCCQNRSGEPGLAAHLKITKSSRDFPSLSVNTQLLSSAALPTSKKSFNLRSWWRPSEDPNFVTDEAVFLFPSQSGNSKGLFGQKLLVYSEYHSRESVEICVDNQ